MSDKTTPSTGVAGVLALMRSQAESHRNNAPVDAYDAQQAPKWIEAIRTVEAMAGAASKALNLLDMGLAAPNGTRITLHLTRAQQTYDLLAAALAAFGSAAPKDWEAKLAAFAVRDHSDGKLWMVSLDKQHASRQAELNDDTLVPLYDHTHMPAGYTTDKDGSIVPGSVYEGVEYDNTPLATPAGGGGELPGYVKTALAACEPHHAQTIRDFIESRRLASTGSAPPNRSSETTSAPSVWRPIKAAPDQKEPYPVVLLCDESGNRWTDVYPGECWRSNGCGSPPVYWQPLPAAPTQ